MSIVNKILNNLQCFGAKNASKIDFFLYKLVSSCGYPLYTPSPFQQTSLMDVRVPFYVKNKAAVKISNSQLRQIFRCLFMALASLAAYHLVKWFSTFFTWRHTKHQNKIGGTLIANKT
jgi:hypothetical protein